MSNGTPTSPEITLDDLIEMARQAYFKGRGRIERKETLPPSVKEDWRRVVYTVIQNSLGLPHALFEDIANIELKDILEAEGITEEEVKQAAKEGAAEAIAESSLEARVSELELPP